jgi:hypothetical protein
MKTDPPTMMVFSLETTQWMIFDSYMQAWEDLQRAVIINLLYINFPSLSKGHILNFIFYRKWKNK